MGERKLPPGIVAHLDGPHYCDPPRLWWWRQFKIGDVWECPECETRWVLTVDEAGRYWQELSAWQNSAS